MKTPTSSLASARSLVLMPLVILFVACSKDNPSIERQVSTSSSASSSSSSSSGTTKVSLEYKGIAKDVCTEDLPTERVDYDNMKIELVKNGFKGAEGPVWVASENKLFFSEINRNPKADMLTSADLAISNIISLDPKTKESEIWIEASGTNGLALSTDGRDVIAAVTPTAEVVKFDLASKTRAVAVDKFEDGEPLNATNDLAVRSDGTIYVTDPTWGGKRKDGGDPAPNSTSVFMISPDNVVTKVVNELIQPNGVALSPDEKKLYVSAVLGKPKDFGWQAPSVIYSYDIAEDGTVSNPKNTFEQGAGGDGIVSDCAGNIYVTARGRVNVIDADGKKLGSIKVFHNAYQASNVTFGGDDHRTLFITVEQKKANGVGKEHGIYKVDLPIQGLPH